MYTVITVLIIIISILLVLIVLVQNSKGGGLASNFSSSNQYMGVRKTADFLEKSTWTLAIVMVVLSLASVFAIKKPLTSGAGTDMKKITEMPVAPVPPAAQPAAQSAAQSAAQPAAQPAGQPAGQPTAQPMPGNPGEVPVKAE